MKYHKFIATLSGIIFLSLALICAFGCGKYGPPLPPEALSPESVKALQTVGQVDGVKFNWQSPEKDLRGKELATIDGYRIYRKEITVPKDVIDKDVPFDLLTTIPDQHLVTLSEMRKEALAAQKPARRLKVDNAAKKFEYVDASAKPGTTYVYKVVPYNQGDVEGGTKQTIKVMFRGESSEISLIDNTTIDSELLGETGGY